MDRKALNVEVEVVDRKKLSVRRSSLPNHHTIFVYFRCIVNITGIYTLLKTDFRAGNTNGTLVQHRVNALCSECHQYLRLFANQVCTIV